MIYLTAADSAVLERLLYLQRRSHPCATLAALRALHITGIATGHLVVCDSAGDSAMHLYRWNSTSSAADDGVNVVKPTAVTGAGRWLINDAATSVFSQQAGYAATAGDADTLDGLHASAFAKASSYAITAANLTLDASHDVVSVTSAGKTVTLPTSVGIAGKQYSVDNASTGAVYLTGTGGQTIQGEVTQTIPVDSSITVVATGTAWRII